MITGLIGHFGGFLYGNRSVIAEINLFNKYSLTETNRKLTESGVKSVQKNRGNLLNFCRKEIVDTP